MFGLFYEIYVETTGYLQLSRNHQMQFLNQRILSANGNLKKQSLTGRQILKISK